MNRTVQISSLLGTWSLLAAPMVLSLSVFFLQSCGTESQSDPSVSAQERPHVVAASSVEAGRYLSVVAGCNDCHTAGYLQKKGDVPEENRLTGNPVGWRGPWGTTYASNLRRYVDTISADAFVKVMHTRTAMPPMPWMNVNEISEQDARAIYAYLKHLGPKGKATPENVPPGQEPKTPYIVMTPQKPGAKPPADTSAGRR